ncbi:MAG: radical SAM protein, partial [SAR202 cluster bacterium]|nr:radical SAM protein [SAR202 cluster bacterium]
MRVGVLELLADTEKSSWTQSARYYLFTKQYASIMPQAVAVWSRQLGHEAFYATWYGNGDPKKLLPNDLDVVFIAAYTQASALAYALGKLYRQEKALTVIGGPHAKSFPNDCARFFDLVVVQFDKTLLKDILDGAFSRGSVITTARPLDDVPTVQDRLPEIKRSAFARGSRPYLSTTVPMLSSVGCPYTCNFCTDWNNPYSLLPLDRLSADLKFLSEKLPGVKMAFHDPNFAVKFDDTLDAMEKVPKGRRTPYIMESSLSILRGAHLQRLKDTNCLYAAPGIESWSSYSNKSGVGKATGSEKVEALAEHIAELHEYVPGIQLNFMFGLDVDRGREPVELTKDFLSRTPYAWPAVNIPVPFGGTPLFDQYLKDERILRAMPFSFYYMPYLVTTIANYDPVDYYEKLIEICMHISSYPMLTSRMTSTPSWALRTLHLVRSFEMRDKVRKLRRILHALKTDRQVR